MLIFNKQYGKGIESSLILNKQYGKGMISVLIFNINKREKLEYCSKYKCYSFFLSNGRSRVLFLPVKLHAVSLLSMHCFNFSLAISDSNGVAVSE